MCITFVYVYVYIYIYIYNMCMYVYTKYVYICIYMCIYMCIYIYIEREIDIYLYMYYVFVSGTRLPFSTCSMSNASIQSAGAWVTASGLGAASDEDGDGRLGRHQVREVRTS